MMRLNHKLRAVIRHEFLTIVKQPSFWISLLAVPFLIGIVMLIGYFTDSKDDAGIDKTKDLSIVVIDSSGLTQPDIAKQYKIQFKDADAQTEQTNRVKSGKLDGLIVYPANIENDKKFLVFADNTDENNAAILNQLGRTLLQQSLLSPLDEKKAALALGGGESTSEVYTNGEPIREFGEKIVPGAFLVLFYMVLIFSVGYALTSISEEKENRSIEMVLSYIKPRALILGKLLAIVLVTLLQLVIIAAIAGIAYLAAKSLGNNLTLPFSINDLTFIPFEILIGVGFLMFGFIFYVALMAMIGAIFPSSKEASGFSTVFFILPAVPFWGIDAITNQASSPFTQALTYFPLTAPTTVLLRNATGNLSVVEGIVSLVILILATFIAIYLAAKAFRLGTLEFSNRIKFTSLLRK